MVQGSRQEDIPGLQLRAERKKVEGKRLGIVVNLQHAGAMFRAPFRIFSNVRGVMRRIGNG